MIILGLLAYSCSYRDSDMRKTSMELETSEELKVAGTTDVVVRRLLTTIERCREEGNKIPQIYRALVQRHGIKMTLGSFRNAYYRQRQNYEKTDSKHDNKRNESAVGRDDSNENTSSINREDFTKVELSSHKAPDIGNPSRKRRKLDFSTTLEEHQKLAASKFFK